MKKAIPFFCAASYGVFGALFVVCTLNVFSMIMSPFYRGEQPRFFAFCVAAVIFSALLVIGTFFFNILRFPDLNDRRKVEGVVWGEVFLSLLLFFPCWALWDHVMEILMILA